MIEMQVRCCCEPRTILGYLKVPHPMQAGMKVNFAITENGEMEVVALPVCMIEVGSISLLAIKSETMNIDQLKRIEGFRAVGVRS